MDRIRIRGGKPLSGTIPIGGAKNAALPLMTAALLSDEPLTLRHVPVLADITTLSHLLVQHGAAVTMVGARAPRRGAGVAARRLCHRHAAGRSPYQGDGSAWRQDRVAAGLHPRPGPA